jgi:NADH dehydrogenase FAD-containing subunit
MSICDSKNRLSVFVYLYLALLMLPIALQAHENWVLTPPQIRDLNAQPRPYLFTHLTPINVSLLLFSLVVLAGWVALNRTGARELFPDLQVRLASHGGFASLSLRVALFILLGMAGLGLGPRSGTALWEAPTLAAPDLELRLAGPGWEWIAWVEVILALCFFFGIYVRAAAAVTLALGILGFKLFGFWMIDYIGLIGGAASYLLFQGAGSYYIPLPSVPGTKKIVAWLASVPRLRAQKILNILAGLNLFWLGIAYKFFQPNLMRQIFIDHHIPTFGIPLDVFILIMAVVEGISGLLVVFGVLMRPLSIILFIAFVFFSALLAEGVFGHIIFYGLLGTFITNGEGRWRRSVATDRRGKIVILGASFAGVHSALKLERLLDEFTNTAVTLVHRESQFLFHPLLSELVGGDVQPGSIVNPIRRLCPRTRTLQGEVASIDDAAKKVHVTLTTGEKLALEYDQLIVAFDPEVSFGAIPGLLEHSVPIMSLGDALYLRQQVLERMGEAELISEPRERQAQLTFSVVGGGLRGVGTAAELRALVSGALASYPGIDRNEPRVLLFEEEPELLSPFGSAMGSAARGRLRKLGVEVFTGTKVAAVTPADVVVAADQRFPCHTVVDTLSARPNVVANLPMARPDGRLPVNEYLQCQGAEHILAVGDSAGTETAAPAFRARREIKMGRCAAYNALALHRGYKLQRWSEKWPKVSVVALGRHATVANFFGITVTGIPAWIVARAVCLLTLPGLERNLRVLADWLLDIPFRSDIVELAPQQTKKLGRAHFEPGDVIIRQGDQGDCAYLINHGELEVLRQEGDHQQQVAKLKSGDCFGEIALLADVPRTATVRCLTPVDVLVLPRDEFMTLAEGYRDFGSALRSRMMERMAEDSLAEPKPRATSALARDSD